MSFEDSLATQQGLAVQTIMRCHDRTKYAHCANWLLRSWSTKWEIRERPTLCVCGLWFATSQRHEGSSICKVWICWQFDLPPLQCDPSGQLKAPFNRFEMFHHPAWAACNPPSARAVGTKSTGGFNQSDGSPCISSGPLTASEHPIRTDPCLPCYQWYAAWWHHH